VPFDDRVRCSVANGTVDLSGRVPMLAERLAAEETAWRTRGVRHVLDHIVVTGHGEGA
jgi:osmotically-inducible protein OsmY